MAISALLVTTTTRWIDTVRAPRALARAGFDVALLAPRGSLAEHSRYVAKIGHVPDQATPALWIFAFAAMVKATQPRLFVPGDDTALRLLNAMATSPPEEMQPALALQLAMRRRMAARCSSPRRRSPSCPRRSPSRPSIRGARSRR